MLYSLEKSANAHVQSSDKKATAMLIVRGVGLEAVLDPSMENLEGITKDLTSLALSWFSSGVSFGLLLWPGMSVDTISRYTDVGMPRTLHSKQR
jgi:hypothetical protein